MKTGFMLAAGLLLALGTTPGCDKKKDEGAAAGGEKAAESGAEKKSGGDETGEKKSGTEIAKAGEGNTAKKVGLETGGKSLGGEKVALNKLKFGGTGFDASFNEALDSWTVEKWKPNEDGGNDQILTVYVDGWNSEWPTEMDPFKAVVSKKDFLDMGSTWTPEKGEKFEGGWVLTGTSNDGEDTEVAFIVRLDKLNAMCRGYVKTDVAEADRAAVRDDAIAACKASKIE